MPFYTPLRYPGGKRRLAPVVVRLLEENRLRNVDYVEPYAGGAAIAWALLLGEHASTVHINDLSRPVYAFWRSVLNQTSDLCRRVETAKLTMREWHRQRAVYEDAANADLSDLGFAALFLNRTNRSGIIGGGVIGGQRQKGAWGLDARFNKTELVQRIRRIGRYKSRINLYQQDALAFTQTVLPALGLNTFCFYDPPYIENGEDLYLNNYDVDGHKQLAAAVSELTQPWVVTYDSAAIRIGLYPSQRRMVYSLNYAAQERYAGREVMFIADRVSLPSAWNSSRRFLMSQDGSRFPLYGKMENTKPRTDLQEGPKAFERFRQAVKTVMSVPKGALPPRPTRGKKKAAKRRV